MAPEITVEEKALLSYDLQEAYLEVEHQLGKQPSSTEFYNSIGSYWQESASLMAETFGSYSDLLRSLGKTPKNQRCLQDVSQEIFESDVDLPLSHRDLMKQDSAIGRAAIDRFGSHVGAMEALGLFDEYEEVIKNSPPGSEESGGYQKAIKRRRKDRQSQIDNLEEELGKYYSAFSSKYSVE